MTQGSANGFLRIAAPVLVGVVVIAAWYALGGTEPDRQAKVRLWF